jgi:hypothetical protein
LKNNKITYKKIKENHYPYDNEKFEKQRNKLIENLKNVNYNPISIDESAIYLGTRNNYGWSEKGKECEIYGKMKKQKLSLILAINREKVIGYSLINKSFDGKNIISL